MVRSCEDRNCTLIIYFSEFLSFICNLINGIVCISKGLGVPTTILRIVGFACHIFGSSTELTFLDDTSLDLLPLVNRFLLHIGT